MRLRFGIIYEHGLRLTGLETNLYHLNKICYGKLTSDCRDHRDKIE